MFPLPSSAKTSNKLCWHPTVRKTGPDLPNQPPLSRERLSKMSGFNSTSLHGHNGNCPELFSISWKYRGKYNFSITLPTPPGDHNQRWSLRCMRVHFGQMAAHQDRNWTQSLKVWSVPMNGRMEEVYLVCRCPEPPETNQRILWANNGRCRN